MASTMETPKGLRDRVLALEANQSLDSAAKALGTVATKVGSGTRGDALRGNWLGHALHPLLTDFPLGCWLSAGLLDLVGGRSSRKAAQRLIGIGLVMVPPTAASGMADYSTLADERVRRVGAVHGAGNVVVGSLYFLSWRARRRGQHARGVALGMGGGLLAWVTGYLGGHLSFARGASVESRGLDVPAITTGDAAPAFVGSGTA